MMNPVPKIAIVIPHYNSGSYFHDAYNSLIRQTEGNWEAIIVDDASTDGSWDLVKSKTAGDPRFRLFENAENLGAASALQRAVKDAAAPLFARLDPDDALAPDALEKMLKAHKEHPEAGLVYSNHFVCDAQLVVHSTHHGRQMTADLSSEDSFLYNREISQFASFRKEVFERTAGIHTFNKRAEDVDMYLKMCEAAPVLYIDETLYYYRIRPGSRRQFENAERAWFWYWVALIKAAERRGLNIEDFFVKHCARRSELNVYINREERIRKMLNANVFTRSAVAVVTKLGIVDMEKFLGKS